MKRSATRGIGLPDQLLPRRGRGLPREDIPPPLRGGNKATRQTPFSAGSAPPGTTGHSGACPCRQSHYDLSMTPESAQRMAQLMVLLKDGLEEFVTDRLRSRYGDSWTGEARAIVYRNMPQAAPKGGGIQWDVYGLFTVITVRWTDCFASVLSKRARSLVEELRATRNEIAHQHFHAEDEPRAMDSAKRLLGEIETDAAKNASARIELIDSPRQPVSRSNAVVSESTVIRKGTNADTVLEYLKSDRRALCDDCLSDLTRVRPRQTIYMVATQLSRDGLITRDRYDNCAKCGKSKICNSVK